MDSSSPDHDVLALASPFVSLSPILWTNPIRWQMMPYHKWDVAGDKQYQVGSTVTGIFIMQLVEAGFY